MSFSLRWLFSLVAVAALFMAAFTFENEWWTISMVSLTLVIVISATVGTCMRLLYTPFWLPFCIVCWIYLAIAFSNSVLFRLSQNLLTTRLAYELWLALHPDKASTLESNLVDVDVYNYLGTTAFTFESAYVVIELCHSLATLLFGTLAGVVVSYCVRRSKAVARSRAP